MKKQIENLPKDSINIDFKTSWLNKEEVDKIFNLYINKHLPEKRVHWTDTTSDESTTRFIFHGPGFMKIETFTEEDHQYLIKTYPQEYEILPQPQFKVIYDFMKNFQTENNGIGVNAYFTCKDNEYPQLAFIENNELFAPLFSDTKDWEYQKFILRSSSMIYSIIFENIGLTHLTIANSCNLASKEVLSTHSCLRRLLHIFTCGTTQMNFKNACLVLPYGFNRLGLDNVEKILQYGMDNFIWKTFPQHIIDAGLSNLKLPIIQDGLRVWDIIEEFVINFVNTYIDCENDKIKDIQIINFWNQLQLYFPLKNKLPLTADKTILIEYLSKFIFNVTAFNCHIGEIVEYFNPYTYSFIINKNIPCAPKMSLGINFWTNLRNINTSPMLLDSWNHIFNDFTLFAYANSLFEDFQERLQELAIQIDTENTNRKWRFRNFNPRYFNSSVSN